MIILKTNNFLFYKLVLTIVTNYFLSFKAVI